MPVYSECVFKLDRFCSKRVYQLQSRLKVDGVPGSWSTPSSWLHRLDWRRWNVCVRRLTITLTVTSISLCD